MRRFNAQQVQLCRPKGTSTESGFVLMPMFSTRQPGETTVFSTYPGPRILLDMSATLIRWPQTVQKRMELGRKSDRNKSPVSFQCKILGRPWSVFHFSEWTEEQTT